MSKGDCRRCPQDGAADRHDALLDAGASEVDQGDPGGLGEGELDSSQRRADCGPVAAGEVVPVAVLEQRGWLGSGVGGEAVWGNIRYWVIGYMVK